MRIYLIALFVFSFTLALSITDSLGIFNYSYSFSTPEAPNPRDITPPQQNVGEFGIGLVLYAFVIFIKVILESTILLPSLLARLGVPAMLNAAITTMVWVTYAVGAIEFFSGRKVDYY